MPARFLWILIIFLGSYRVTAQVIDEKNFRHYTTQDGLSDNKITGLAQDSTGYIWIATYHGLNRFDGITFKQFLRNSQHNPIPENTILSMQLLPGNQLAIATDDGAQIISTKTLETKNLDIPTPDVLRYWSNCCQYILNDKDGNYGVSTRTGFYIFSANGMLKKRYDYYTEKDIGHAWMLFGNHILNLPDGNMLQENSEGVYFYDRLKNFIGNARQNWPGLNEIFKISTPKPRFFFISAYKMLLFNSQKNSFDIIDIRNGTTKSFPACFNVLQEIGWQSKLNPVNDSLWTINSRNKGFYFLKIDTVTWTVSCNPNKYFSDQFCNIVFYDNKKRLWIGTNHGFYIENLHPRHISSFVIEAPKKNEDFSITALLVTHKKIFAGTDKKELFVLDKESHKINKHIIFKRVAERSDKIKSMLLVHPDTLWIASTSELLWLNTKNYSYGTLFLQGLFDSSKTFVSLFSDQKNNIWIGSNAINSVIYYNKQTKKIDSITDTKNQLFKINMINSFAEDINGNIWMGGDAIARWNSGLKKIDTLIEHLSTQRNRKRGYIVMNDSSGRIWTTVNDDGIASVTGTSLIHVRPINLLPDNSINFIPSLQDDKIFLATNNSIGFLNIHTLKSTVFDNDDGMPSEPVTSYYFSYDSVDKSTWFACKNTICKISFNEKINYHDSPFLKIAEISVINDTVINYPPSFISLKYFQNDIKISLSTINFTNPPDVRFAYRLKNKNDSDWIETGAQPIILLTNISPGDYKLEIKAYSYNNKWPEQTTELEIKIKSPFWKTWWFTSLFVFAMAAAAYLLYKRRIRQVREKANIDKQLTEFEMKALHAQMNPHFIFNCLNSIREMILNNENRQASHYLSKFAQLIRITLNQSSKPFISLRNTIDYLERYLEMEQVRNNQFIYSIELDDKLPAEEIMIPPMLIQPFLENAIWHGALPGKEMQLKILFLKQDHQLICIVDDNGMGIEASLKTKKEMQVSHNSIGIANVKERIQVLNEKYNLRSSITIEDKSVLAPRNGTGTIVKLHFPLNSLHS